MLSAAVSTFNPVSTVTLSEHVRASVESERDVVATRLQALEAQSRRLHELTDVVDADLHDFRDSKATREVYVHDSARLGIQRNRARVLVRRSEVVAVARLVDVQES